MLLDSFHPLLNGDVQVSFCTNSLDHVTLKDLKIRGRERLLVRDLT